MRASRKPEAQDIVMKEHGIASGMETNTKGLQGRYMLAHGVSCGINESEQKAGGAGYCNERAWYCLRDGNKYKRPVGPIYVSPRCKPWDQ
jgi:hypothetical protein